MPRSRSSVTTSASLRSPRGATQTLRTPWRGAIQARRLPSGEMRGLMRSGLPKSTCRGMRGVPVTMTTVRRFQRHRARLVTMRPRVRAQEAALAVSAYILIQTEVGKASQVATEVRQIDGVISAEDVTGPYDVI